MKIYIWDKEFVLDDCKYFKNANAPLFGEDDYKDLILYNGPQRSTMLNDIKNIIKTESIKAKKEYDQMLVEQSKNPLVNVSNVTDEDLKLIDDIINLHCIAGWIDDFFIIPDTLENINKRIDNDPQIDMEDKEGVKGLVANGPASIKNWVHGKMLMDSPILACDKSSFGAICYYEQYSYILCPELLEVAGIKTLRALLSEILEEDYCSDRPIGIEGDYLYWDLWYYDNLLEKWLTRLKTTIQALQNK